MNHDGHGNPLPLAILVAQREFQTENAFRPIEALNHFRVRTTEHKHCLQCGDPMAAAPQSNFSMTNVSALFKNNNIPYSVEAILDEHVKPDLQLWPYFFGGNCNCFNDGLSSTVINNSFVADASV